VPDAIIRRDPEDLQPAIGVLRYFKHAKPVAPNQVTPLHRIGFALC
jgi:hypothetical protein